MSEHEMQANRSVLDIYGTGEQDRQCTCNLTLRGVLRNYCCLGKAIRIIHPERARV